MDAVEEMTSGAHRFTVPQAESDELLRAMLGARPPWHVVSVIPAPAALREPEPEMEPEPAKEPESERELEVENS